MSWEVSLDVSGRKASTGGRMLPEGNYKGKVISAEAVQTTTGRPQIKLVVKVSEGEFEGTERTTWISLPQEGDENLDTILNIWRTTLESVGHTAADLDSGAVTLSESALVNRDCHFYYKPGDKDQSIRAKLYLQTTEAYNKATGNDTNADNANANAKAAANNGTKAPAAKPKPLGGGAKGMTPEALAAALGG